MLLLLLALPVSAFSQEIDNIVSIGMVTDGSATCMVNNNTTG
ncbi:MAG: hypothetical protein ACXVCR_07435 [Bdellovibrio sp.]